MPRDLKNRFAGKRSGDEQSDSRHGSGVRKIKRIPEQ